MVVETKYQVLERVKDRICDIEYWENGIIFYNLQDHVTVELEDSIRQYEYLKSKFDGKNKLRVLVESGRYTDVTKEAREFSARPETNAMTLASAVIIKSLAHRILINFMIHFTKQQNMKMRMFEDREKAIQWLLRQKQ